MMLVSKNKKSITFLFPGVCYKPVGGTIMVLEYANRLAADGLEIHLVYPCSLFFKKASMKNKVMPLLRYCRFYNSYSVKRWFHLNENIREHMVPSLAYDMVPHTFHYVATGVETAYYLNDYPNDVKKIYFIQDFETWAMSEKEVRMSYHFPMQKVVISKWLEKILADEEDVPCQRVPNGFDSTKYQMTIPIREKNKYVISMQYHIRPAKGIPVAFRVLYEVKKRIPQLEANIFGIYKIKENIPDWMHFYYNPSLEQHNYINNISAIYLGTSKMEGWGLTVGEAMMCGQAVVCTDNQGYREMAIDEENALLAPVDDVEKLAEQVVRLIKDDSLRWMIAEKGNRYIMNFTIEESYNRFSALFNQ